MCSEHIPTTAAEDTKPSLSRRTLIRGASAAVVAGGALLGGAVPALAATSQNGWPASEKLPLTAIKVGKADFPPGVLKGNVAVVLTYVAQQFNAHVEPLHDGWCWGFSYRKISGSTQYSNHSSGTAIDCNAPDHPLGKEGTFTKAQVAAIHKIISYCDGVVRWGGDYNGRKDEMHFEINVGPSSPKLPALVKKIKG
ncbi:M15 family metallopeptidase [Psychromicrobium lacuslunae]|uniref:M15 family metallopeptidase n=1 Tax=Psychromicrobium lacuslunae TaxID=1618207 RepID=UPI0009E547A9|nr:M15 family metallopeptidase [Psychromicrobium lacuslunae]